MVIRNDNSPIFIACRPTGVIVILLTFCIAILLSGNASATNLLVNGDFETGDLSNWTTGWTSYGTDYWDGGYAKINFVASSGIYGDWYISIECPPPYGSGDTSWLYKDNIDFSMIDSLQWDWKGAPNNGNWGNQRAVDIWNDDNLIYHEVVHQDTSWHNNESFDLSNYSGVGKIRFSSDGCVSKDNILCIDNIIGIPSPVNSVSWNQSSYSVGDIGSIAYYINGYDSSTYDYSIDIFKDSTLKSFYHLTSNSGNTSYTFFDVDESATYYAKLTKRVKGSSIPLVIIIDTCLVSGSSFNYNISIELDEYSPGSIVNVTYTTDQKGTVQVVKTISNDIYHSIGFISGATNATWQFYIASDEPYGFYDVYLLDSSNTILDSVRYSLLPATSSLDILQSSVDLHETFVVFAQTVNESILSIEDPDGVEVWNELIGALMYDYIYYTPTIKTGIYTAYLYDDVTLNDTVMVYLTDPPIIDDPLDPETNGSIVVEDVLEDDESMTEYFDGKFREFAPTAWGIFLLSIILWLMAILTSFGGSGKRR